jgi:O-antigen ligase
MGPLGLFSFYTIIGLVSSLLLSTNVFQAVYFALAFGSPLLILMLALSDNQPEQSMSQLLTLSWLVAVVMMVGIVLALPFIGGPSLLPTDGNLFHVKGGWGVQNVAFADMPGPRGTGLARYAAVAGLASLGGISQGKLVARLFWVAMVPASIYVLLAAQGRTEILAFIIAAGVLLLVRHSSRYILLTWGLAGALLMARAGLFARFWEFGSRTGQFDPTLTGRTVTWQQGWELLGSSPLVGLGFFADRIFLQMQHIHNGLLHALIQSGILGSAAFVGAFVVAWLMVLRLYLVRGSTAFFLHPEVPAVLLFFTLMNVTESTAQFSSNWLFLAPVMAWIQLAFWKSYAGKTAPPGA